MAACLYLPQLAARATGAAIWRARLTAADQQAGGGPEAVDEVAESRCTWRLRVSACSGEDEHVIGSYELNAYGAHIPVHCSAREV